LNGYGNLGVGDCSMSNRMPLFFNVEDLSQVIIGAFALAVPIAFTEEAWHLAQSLPLLNLFSIFCLSICFISIYTYESVFQKNLQSRVWAFICRVAFVYVISGIIVGLVLFSINKFSLILDPALALKRLVIVGMPASIGGIIVDSFDKE